MCDYSLEHIRSRPAAVGDKLVVHNFGTGTIGFACRADPVPTAVCCLPGTELAFDNPVNGFTVAHGDMEYPHRVARFRQLDKDMAITHHDALEFPNGEVVKLTNLAQGQTATVLQLPASPKLEAASEKIDPPIEYETIGY